MISTNQVFYVFRVSAIRFVRLELRVYLALKSVVFSVVLLDRGSISILERFHEPGMWCSGRINYDD